MVILTESRFTSFSSRVVIHSFHFVYISLYACRRILYAKRTELKRRKNVFSFLFKAKVFGVN